MPRFSGLLRFLGRFLAVMALFPMLGNAGTIELRPDSDWFAVLNGSGLKPGDQVILRGGTYSNRRMLVLNHRGSKDQPVVIRAARGERVIFRRPDARQNSFNLVGTQFLELRDFEITGGSAGIRIRADGDVQPKAVTLEGLHIHHIGGAAVTCNNAGSYYESMRFRRNHIHHTGGHAEGFYLGCNNDESGGTPGYIFDSIIEHNHIHDLKGKHVSQGDGIEIKDGSYGNIIRDNVIHDTNYPGIIVYGTDGKDPNIIERNIIWNTGDHGIQAAADAVIRNNIVGNTGGDGLHVRDHQSATPGTLVIVHNTFTQSKPGKTGIRIQRPSGGFSERLTVANNAIYAELALRVPGDRKLAIAGNVGAGESEDKTLPLDSWNPGGDLAADLDRNRFPTAASFLIGKADSQHVTEDDFLARPRGESLDVGAYWRTEANSWRIAPGFKR